MILRLAGLSVICMLLLQVFNDLREGQVKPVCEGIRLFMQQRPDAVQRQVAVRLYFSPVWRYDAIICSYQHVIEFIFSEPVIKTGLVGKAENFFQGAIETHFFHQAAVGGRQGIFPGKRMAAAGVGPEAAGMIFILRALLQQHFTGGIYDEHRKGAVEQAFLVSFQFFHGAYRFILFIDEYNGW